MSKQVIELHATQLRSSQCRRLLYLNVVRELTSKFHYNDSLFGTCFHKFAETYESTDKNLMAAILTAQNLWRIKTSEPGFKMKDKADHLDINRLTTDCHKWAETVRPNDPWEIVDKMVEFNFHHLMYSDDNIEILFSGTIDKICRHKNSGVYAIGDYKTTRGYDKLSFFRKFKLEAQPIGYVYAIHKQAVKYPDSIFGDIVRSGQFGFFVDGVFLAAKETTFERGEFISYSPEVLAEFEAGLTRVVSMVVETWKDGAVYSALPPRDGVINGACSNFGGCAFAGACAQEHAFDNVIEQYFMSKKRGEIGD